MTTASKFKCKTFLIVIYVTIMLVLGHSWAKVGTVYSKMGGRGIPRICRGAPRNFANGAAEFGKICRGKLWSLYIKLNVRNCNQYLQHCMQQLGFSCNSCAVTFLYILLHYTIHRTKVGINNTQQLQWLEKEKERKSMYIASFILYIVSKHSDMNHTVYPLHHACLFFVSVHQMAPPLSASADIQLQLNTHQKGLKAEFAWLVDL